MMDGVFLVASPPWWVFLVVPSMILTMGFMMWFIMRMTMGSHSASHAAFDAPKPGASQGSEEEVASLKREVEAEPEVPASLPEEQQSDDVIEHGSHGR